MARPSRFAAILGTKDESDVLPAAIEHLRRIGVGLIIVIDRGSTDGSLEYLAETEKVGDIWLIRYPQRAPYGELSASLAKASGADWVLFLDSDEFWLPRSGTLHDLADLDEADVLSVMRYNVVLGASGPMWVDEPSPERYAEALLYAQPIQQLPGYLRQDPDPPQIRVDVDPKILARPAAIASLQTGSHDIEVPADQDWRQAVARDVLIAHLPMRSYERFEQRAHNIRAVVERNPAMFTGSHWARWAAAAEQGWIRQEYDYQVLPDDELAPARARGDVRSVAEVLEETIAQPASEQDYLAIVNRSQPWVTAAGLACRQENIPTPGVLRSRATGRRPTVVVPPDHIVKFFGPWQDGHAAHRQEITSLELLGRAPALPVPRFIASGELDDRWRYLIHTLMPGRRLAEVRDILLPGSLPDVVRWLARFLRELHAVPLSAAEREAGVTQFATWLGTRHRQLAHTLRERAGLPSRLLELVGDWLPPVAALMPSSADIVLSHGDLGAQHILGQAESSVFVPSGVIDVGTARLAHPMYDWVSPWLSVMHGDRRLFADFVEEIELTDAVKPDFPRLALAWALLHPSWDSLVVPDMHAVATLDQLAERLFGSL